MNENDFSPEGLRAMGFAGGVSLMRFGGRICPKSPGIYLIWRPRAPVRFLEESMAGRFEGRDPSVSDAVLRANWVEGAEVVYIGGTRLPLAERVQELAEFGKGVPKRNWGGRLLWQLADAGALLVWWRASGDLSLKAELLDRFRAQYGKLPFANNPAHLGAAPVR